MAGEACKIQGGGGMDEVVQKILNMKTIAVVGCSPKPERASHYVAEYMRNAGYKIIPVNPGFPEILGEKCYPNLSAIPEKVDVVNLFRKSEEVYPFVQDAIKIGAKAIWMQDGVEHEGAAAKAKEAGLLVVQNDCLMRQHRNHGGPFHKTITTC
jgi:uncharacterized protein